MSEIKINNIPVITENNGSVELTTGTTNIGNNALVVNASGNVGINKANPTIRLDVEGNENILGWFKNNTENGNSRIICQNPNFNVNIGLTGTDGSFNVYHGSTNKSSIMCYPDGYVRKPYIPKFLVAVPSTGFSKSASSWQDITSGFSDTVYDQNNDFDTTSGFTAPIAGLYYFYIGGWTTANSNGSRYAYSFTINGGSYTYIGGSNYCSVDSPVCGYSIAYELNEGDYVKVYMFSAVACTLSTSSHRFQFGGYLIG